MSNFFSLPRELRDQIYELVILHQEPIDPWADYGPPYNLAPELLRTNKTINREASLLLYSQNRFDFTSSTPENVASFVEQIGRNNADNIRHICVDFPKFRYLDLGDVTLEDDSVDIFGTLQSGCASLSTLTTSRYSTNAMELRLDALDNPKLVTEALKLVNTLFRTVSTIQKIIVEVYEDGPSDYIRREMDNHGWTISVAKHEEDDFEGSFSDYEYDDYGYDREGDYDDNDSYDIDKDSDFWRRAAD